MDPLSCHGITSNSISAWRGIRAADGLQDLDGTRMTDSILFCSSNQTRLAIDAQSEQPDDGWGQWDYDGPEARDQGGFHLQYSPSPHASCAPPAAYNLRWDGIFDPSGPAHGSFLDILFPDLALTSLLPCSEHWAVT